MKTIGSKWRWRHQIKKVKTENIRIKKAQKDKIFLEKSCPQKKSDINFAETLQLLLWLPVKHVLTGHLLMIASAVYIRLWEEDGGGDASLEHGRQPKREESRSVHARGHRHLMRVSGTRSRPRFRADRLGVTQLLVPSIINVVTDWTWIGVESAAELVGLRKIVVTGKEPDPSDGGGETTWLTPAIHVQRWVSDRRRRLLFIFFCYL